MTAKKIDITPLTLLQFKKKYCFSRTRADLFDKLTAELDNIGEQIEKMRILVFGSFLSEKEEPSDIDIIISLVPNRDSMYMFMTDGLYRLYPEEIDIQYNRHELLLDSAEHLIQVFNKNPFNKKQGITIEECVELCL